MEFLSSKAVMQRLTKNERWRAPEMLPNGSERLNVAKHFNLSQSVISGLCNSHQQTGNVTELSCSGRPHSTTPRRDHLLVANALRDRIQNATQTAAAAFPRHWSSGHYTNNEEPSTRCSAACSLSERCAVIECQPSPGKEGLVSTPSEVDCRTMV